jgi:TetR/AcrR family transcriptional repressor of nem operon
MRVTADTRTSHGAALLRAASDLFRARGLAAVSVADVSAAAGLTHGAFYGHFASKAALAEAACRAALQVSARRFRARAAAVRDAGGDGLAGIIELYLTERHRDEPQDGCAIAALGGELVRAEPALRDALAAGTAALLEVIADEIAVLRPTAAPATCHAAAIGVLAAMAGGLILARAFADPDSSRTALTAAAAAARAAALA